MPQIASRITRQTLEADVVVFTAKQSVRISTVAVAVDDAFSAGSGKATVFLYTADGSRIYFGLTVSEGTTASVKVPWIADAGLKLVAGATGNSAAVIVTLIHSAPGV